ncbi:helix-hairpin-helix motif domain-containing protein [Toxoplasma gondii p89]|uniref:Adenine DNA glycosylase n=1 Tax=Toxoplasma gondii p89 TaxID=943119 RepID=A0A086L058_TOXGO|nr:helix-hairpin-helix motif domain-containing protein [Toxoplasma gondii p89]
MGRTCPSETSEGGRGVSPPPETYCLSPDSPTSVGTGLSASASLSSSAGAEPPSCSDMEDLELLRLACEDCGACMTYHHRRVLPDVSALTDFRLSLLSWFDAHRRRLPWRGDSPPFTSWNETRAATAGRQPSKKKGEGGTSTPSILRFFAKQPKTCMKRNSPQGSSGFLSCSSSSSSSSCSPCSSSSSPCSSASSSSCSRSAGANCREADLHACAPSPPSEPRCAQSVSVAACGEAEKIAKLNRGEAQEKVDRAGSKEATRRVSPYGVWVSEVMLQQTQVCTVIDYWQRWMSRWPTVGDLVKASEEEVSQMWSGLGYYRRARQLLKGAQTVVQEFDGELPGDVEKLLSIPGIGPYTGGAISAIAFGNRAAAVDGNVLRVLARLLGLAAPADSRALAMFCSRWMPPFLDPRRPGASTEALIELGATICTPRAPSCLSCPVRQFCLVNREAKSGASACEARREIHSADCKLCIPFAEAQAAVRERQQAAYPVAKATKSRPEESYVVLCVTRVPGEREDADAHSTGRRGHSSNSTKSHTACGEDRHTSGQVREREFEQWEILLRRRPSAGLLAGQLEVPSCLRSRTQGAKTPEEKKAATLKKRKRPVHEGDADEEDTCSASSDVVDITEDLTGNRPNTHEARSQQTTEAATQTKEETETQAETEKEKETRNETDRRLGISLVPEGRGRGESSELVRRGERENATTTLKKQQRESAGETRFKSSDNTQKALRELVQELQTAAVIAGNPVFVGEVTHTFSHVQHELKLFWIESNDAETLSNIRATPDECKQEKQVKRSGSDFRRQLEWIPLKQAFDLCHSTYTTKVLQALTDFLRLRGDSSKRKLVKSNIKREAKLQPSLPSRFLG